MLSAPRWFPIVSTGPDDQGASAGSGTAATWLRRLLVALLCFAFFLQDFFASLRKNPTNDEPNHIASGASCIGTGSIVANPQHPPRVNRKTAVDTQRCRQVSDLSGLSTAAQFTQRVTTAVLQTLAAEGEACRAESQTPFLG